MQKPDLTSAPVMVPNFVETLKTIAMFCAVGLTVSLMLASYGVDLSPGFF
jgi:hypothetical protein